MAQLFEAGTKAVEPPCWVEVTVALKQWAHMKQVHRMEAADGLGDRDPTSKWRPCNDAIRNTTTGHNLVLLKSILCYLNELQPRLARPQHRYFSAKQICLGKLVTYFRYFSIIKRQTTAGYQLPRLS